MAATPEPFPIRPGQVLCRPLLDPIKAVPLLAAGQALTEEHIARIRRLGLVGEALRCLATDEWKAPSRPKDPQKDRQADVQRLGSRLYAEIGKFFDAGNPQDLPFTRAWDLLQELVPRIQQLDPAQSQDPRLPGGSALHPLNVMLYATRIGTCLGMSPQELMDLALTALLHDIGVQKLGKERFKTTKLSSYERRLLERHVEYGLDLLDRYRDRFPPISPAVRQGILSHHERWDGSGYPAGLKGEQIPRNARIIAVVDAYDIMLSDQLYRERKLPEQAYARILADSGKAFDPKIVRLFKEVMVPYPNQTLVRLDNGAIARVISQGRAPSRPRVALLDPPDVIDLDEDASLSVVRAVYPRRHGRVARSVPVRLRMPDEHGAYPACSLNLSMGGACVVMDASLPKGTRLVLSVPMPEFAALEVAAVVVWARSVHGKTCLGLSFLPMSAAVRSVLKTLCRS